MVSVVKSCGPSLAMHAVWTAVFSAPYGSLVGGGGSSASVGRVSAGVGCSGSAGPPFVDGLAALDAVVEAH